jgi:hypothetical protein
VTFTEPVTLSGLEAKEAEDKSINSTIRNIFSIISLYFIFFLEETKVRIAELPVKPVNQSVMQRWKISTG